MPGCSEIYALFTKAAAAASDDEYFVHPDTEMRGLAEGSRYCCVTTIFYYILSYSH